MEQIGISVAESQIAVEEIRLIELNNEIITIESIVTDALNSTRQIHDISNVISSNKEENKITTESINLAISIIYENLGAKSYLFSMENNSNELALESLNEFIQKLWEKVKLSIENLWDKVNEFWNNNFSSLNKIKKSLESILLTVHVDYKLTTSKIIDDEEGHIRKHFNNGDDVTDKSLTDFIHTHTNNFNKLDDIIKITKHFNKNVKGISNTDFDNGIDYFLKGLCKDYIQHPFRFGEEKYPIVNGEYLTIEYNYDDENNDITINTEKEKVSINERCDVYCISKHRLEFIIKSAIEIINTTIKYKTIQDQIKNEFKELIRAYDIVISTGEPTLKSDHKKIIRLIYRINSSIPGIFGVIVLSNVKLARSIVHYTEFCLRAK
jgi:hypothetical protein